MRRMLIGRNCALALNTDVKPFDNFANFAAHLASRWFVDFRPLNFKRISLCLALHIFGAMRISLDLVTGFVFGANLGRDFGAYSRLHLGMLTNLVRSLLSRLFFRP